jgi:hypothetical protein
VPVGLGACVCVGNLGTLVFIAGKHLEVNRAAPAMIGQGWVYPHYMPDPRTRRFPHMLALAVGLVAGCATPQLSVNQTLSPSATPLPMATADKKTAPATPTSTPLATPAMVATAQTSAPPILPSLVSPSPAGTHLDRPNILGTYPAGVNPRFVVAEPAGGVWLAAPSGDTITKLTATGSVVGTFAVSAAVASMALDRQGNLWVGQGSTNRVTKLSTSGAALGSFSVASRPAAIAVGASSGIWLVCDMPDTTLIRLFPTGALNAAYALAGVQTPKMALIDGNEHLWVTFAGSDNVAEFDAQGVNLGTFTVGALPTGLALDKDGALWVTLRDSNKVVKLSSFGAKLGTFSCGAAPEMVAIDSAGNAWIANSGDGTVTKLAKDGRLLATYDLPGAYGIASDGGSTMWVTSPANGMVFRLGT